LYVEHEFWGFSWASTSAAVQPPGPSQCAWADRVPQGSELKQGLNSNVVSGSLLPSIYEPQPGGVRYDVLNQGQYLEIGVYNANRPGVTESLIMTTVVGFVQPPFSASPMLPWLGLPPNIYTPPPPCIETEIACIKPIWWKNFRLRVLPLRSPARI
jgi:hypothetical protein